MNKSLKIIEFNNLSNIRVIDYNNKNDYIEYNLGEDIVKNLEIIDYAQYDYILSKIINKISKNENIIIRYNSLNNIYRFEDNINLTDDDLPSYLEYNLDKIIPFNLENIIVKGNISEKQIHIYGIDKSTFEYLLSHFNQITENIFFTVIISEIVSKIYELGENFIFIFFSKNHVEISIIENRKTINYKSRFINENSTDSIEFIKSIILAYKHISKVFINGEYDLINYYYDFLNNQLDKDVNVLDFDEKTYLGE